LTVLRRDADARSETGFANGQPLNQRGHLDRFRARAEDGENFQHKLCGSNITVAVAESKTVERAILLATRSDLEKLKPSALFVYVCSI
jgi:hypothetical protein